MLPLKTILHPTDFSDASEHALRLAVGLAQPAFGNVPQIAGQAPAGIEGRAEGGDGLAADQRLETGQ